MLRKKPHTFGARKKPFRVQINLKQGMVVTGASEDRKGISYWARFTKPVPVKEGDVFSYDSERGFVLNGKPHPVNMRPFKKQGVQMAWAPKRMRVAVFKERDRIYDRRKKKFTKRFGKPYWCAVDTRGYWLGTGDTVEVAVNRLLDQVQVTELMHKEEEKKGVRVIRWHCERQPDVRKEMLEDEKKAKKTGFILEGVDWRKSVSSRGKP